MDLKNATFQLKDTFVAQYAKKQPQWGPLGYITYKRCVSIDTPVLTADLQWLPAGELGVGAKLLAFEEERQPGSRGRRLEVAEITHSEIEDAECVEITLSTGEKLVCTPDHSWLVKKASNRLVWVEAKDLLRGNTVKCSMLRYFDVWDPVDCYIGGYLAAAFDGEGSLDRHRGLTFTQVDNEMLSQVREYLDIFDFQYNVKPKKRVNGRQQCYSLRITGHDQVARFLGMFRPPRLLAKYLEIQDQMQLKRQKFRHKEDIEVVSVRPVGKRKIAVISTSSKTHFTGGYPSHNTYARSLDAILERCQKLAEKYKLKTSEEWWLTLVRVVEGTYKAQEAHCKSLKLPWNPWKAQKSAQTMFELMWNFKFLPPGRGLWMMGTKYVEERGGAALNNPLGEQTLMLTQEYGWIPIGELEGQDVTVLTSTKLYGRDHSGTAAQAAWAKATISHAEYHPCTKITYRDKFGQTTTVLSSRNHRWFRRRTKTPWERVSTEELNLGDYLPITKTPIYFKLSQQGCQHGLFFGDGTRSNGELHQFDKSIKILERLFVNVETINEGHKVVRQCPYAWSSLPAEQYASDQRYLYGFLAGYFAADGHVTQAGQLVLNSSRLDELQTTKNLFQRLSIRTSDIFQCSTKSNLVEDRNPLYGIRINATDLDEQFFLHDHHRERWLNSTQKDTKRDWLQIVGLEPVSGTHRVLCATVPDYEQFVIEGNCLTSNCAFVSTEDIKTSFSSPFCFLMDMSMLGVGVGGDVRGAGTIIIKEPRTSTDVHKVPDTREGWVELIRRHLDAYVGADILPAEVDFSDVRPAGAQIKGFGGLSSGPEPLAELVESIHTTLQPLIGEAITVTAIVDIFNLIGRCVVAGNVRRTAEIMFGEPGDQEFIELKDPESYSEQLKHHRWASNNSLFAEVGQDYTEAAARTARNGEPGYLWLDNARRYSRMVDPPDKKDMGAGGANPCFAADTLIAVADGRRAVSIKQLAEEGNDVPVYSVSPETGMVEIKWARNPRLTRRDAQLVKITLDDGSCLQVTPDHKMLLRDGTPVKAKDLKPNDSLPRFTARLEPVKKGGNSYYRIYCNTRETHKNKYFEHRLIAQFYQPEKWQQVYGNTKENGWIQGGLVVHHRDFNPLNNLPDNLEIMTFRDHAALHGSIDNSGSKNPMYGRTHSRDLKQKIGQKTKERCSNPAYIRHLSASHTDAERQASSLRLSQTQRERLREYYLEQERVTDLRTTWINDSLHAAKTCETCSREFVVPWRARGQCYCSRQCMNKAEHHIQSRRQGQQKSFAKKQQATLERQIDTFLSLKNRLGRDPLATEWKDLCKERGVSHRFNPQSANLYVLESYKDLCDRAHDYNHRVMSVEFLQDTQDVYNLSVEDHHTVGIITDTNNFSSGIFTFQCAEQTLESFELCNLVETFPSRHDSYDEYERTLKFAYLYAKTVTLIPTHDERTNAVMMRNRRIGTSQSGIVQAFKRHGRRHIFQWCDDGYHYLQKLDHIYSRWLCVPSSVKITSIKPSGTVSLLPGVTPGIHYPHSEYYHRVIRFSNDSPLLNKLRRAGYNCIDLGSNEPNTTAVYFPVKEEYFDRKKSDVSMWEQLENAAQYQTWWADNQVSCTVTFDEREADQIQFALQLYETRLKGISFLPSKDHGYEHAPYQEIDEATYNEAVNSLKKLNLSGAEAEMVDKWCNGDTCEIPPPKQDG